ncbi:MAG: hypothetical protein LBD55_12710 [Treponema sp.]|nr:hypothetical protein [Treponema sp.]
MSKGYVFLIPVMSVLWSACASSPKESAPRAGSGGPSPSVSPNAAAQKPSSAETPGEKGYEAAYTYRTNLPDRLIQKLPPSIEAYRSSDSEEYIRQIAAYITAHAAGDFDRVKKAHDWLALNIAYLGPDSQAPNQSPEGVIAGGRAAGRGYAAVFKALCDAMSIPCVVIHGYARAAGSLLFDDENPSIPNHAWNKVRIHGDWYMVDTARDAGAFDGRNYEASYSTDYLFLKPEHSVFTHFPANPEDQLLPGPVSASAYVSLAPLNARFFDTITAISPEVRRINRVAGTLELLLTPKGGSEVRVSMYDEKTMNEYTNVAFVQKEGLAYKAYMSFPNPGNYRVQVSSRKRGEKTYTFCGAFGVIAAAGSAVRYPAQYGDFTQEITLMSPLEMPLQKNKSYRFRIKSNTDYVALVMDNRFMQLNPDQQGVFTLDTTIPSTVKEVTVVVGDARSREYPAILKYEVW